MEVIENRAWFGFAIPLADFPALAAEHLRRNPTTPAVESLAATVAVGGFMVEECQSLVSEVCRWGGHSGIGGRVLKRNTGEAIAAAFTSAFDSANRQSPDVSAALRAVNGLSNLGSPSFASKHLRFLAPARCPVFDSYLNELLPHSFDPSGYAGFAEECACLAEHLTGAGIENPRADRARDWFAADVEAAIFTWASARRIRHKRIRQNARR